MSKTTGLSSIEMMCQPLRWMPRATRLPLSKPCGISSAGSRRRPDRSNLTNVSSRNDGCRKTTRLSLSKLCGLFSDGCRRRPDCRHPNEVHFKTVAKGDETAAARITCQFYAGCCKRLDRNNLTYVASLKTEVKRRQDCRSRNSVAALQQEAVGDKSETSLHI